MKRRATAGGVPAFQERRTAQHWPFSGPQEELTEIAGPGHMDIPLRGMGCTGHQAASEGQFRKRPDSISRNPEGGVLAQELATE